MENKPSSAPPKVKTQIINYVFFGFFFTLFIFIFSIIMAGISSIRNEIGFDNYLDAQEIYNGPLRQSAPNLNIIDESSDIYVSNKLTQELVQRYINNTFLTATKGNVVIDADFVKKGLVYQPTYRTEFMAEYTLSNTLNEASFVVFQFPFPVNSSQSEISNAVLEVNGEVIKNAKTKINLSNSTSYDYYYGTEVDGLKWSGKVDAQSEVKVIVKYNTVGLSRFTYEGIENSKGAQDFKFDVQIKGTRSYNVVDGLSVDVRNFDDKAVTLKWDKPALYSKPLINIEVGNKLNPAEQVSRVYLTMTPIYIVFITVILYLAYKFGKKMTIFDMFLITLLFAVYFPFIHYLSSFTIDPTVELFASFKSVPQFSMPLYAAFGIALTIVGGLTYYLLGKISGFKFATKLGLPTLALFIGFFPLVVTIPEYSMLLVIIGAIALMMIVIQVRVKLLSD